MTISEFQMTNPWMNNITATVFSLNNDFTSSYENSQPEWGPMGYPVYKRTYARNVEGENRTEEYWETLQRVVEGSYGIQRWHCNKYHLPWKEDKAQKSAQTMFKLMWDFKFLPPGRGLWMMGTDFMWRKGGAALNNCAFISTKNLSQSFSDPFCFLMDMSMLGVGVGADTKGANTITISKPTKVNKTYLVSDSREGWVDVVRLLLDSYFSLRPFPETINYSLIRQAGERLNGFGGVASGPQPLIDLIEKDIPDILDPLVGHPITSSGIVDLFNAIGKCVIAGNVRRSAEIMFGDPNDEEFLNLKNPKKSNGFLNRWRWASNNSLRASVGMDYENAASHTKVNGEPGYFWLDNARAYGRMIDPPNYKDRRADGANPCSEQTLESYELCCLVETFPAHHDTFEEYKKTLKYAYLYGKTVTLLPTHNPHTNQVMLRNKRIGMSQTGIAQSFQKHGYRTHMSWCDQGYNYLRELDNLYSEWLCVKDSIKITSVKPSGTISLLAGATPGIHFPYAEFYWRTMRLAKNHYLLQPLKDAGYRIEDDVKNPDYTVVVYFPVREKNFQRSRSDLSIWQQLEYTADMQKYWADNQVSVTVTFKPDESSQIKEALEIFETKLKSVSFLPESDHGYVQAPYIKITKDEYEEATSQLRPLIITTNNSEGNELNKGCDGDKCII